MVNHPNRSRRAGPRCLNCTNPIAKLTTQVFAPGPPGQPLPGWQYRGNGIVVARRYADVSASGDELVLAQDEPASPPKTARNLWCVSVWDGESYDLRFGYFCTNECAARFGQSAARAGFRKS